MNVFGRFLPVVLIGLATSAFGAGDVVRFTAVPLPAVASRSLAPSLAAASRGELLYENHCKVCHASVVHVRENHSAKSISDLRAWTRRWSGELKLNWSDEEINDVAEFLARRYYKFGVRPS